MNHDFRKFHFRSILFDEISRSPGSEPLMRLPNDSLQIICSLEWLSEVKNDIMNADWSKLKSNGNKNVIGKTNVETLLLILTLKSLLKLMLVRWHSWPIKLALLENQPIRAQNWARSINLKTLLLKTFYIFDGRTVGKSRMLKCWILYHGNTWTWKKNNILVRPSIIMIDHPVFIHSNKIEKSRTIKTNLIFIMESMILRVSLILFDSTLKINRNRKRQVLRNCTCWHVYFSEQSSADREFRSELLRV